MYLGAFGTALTYLCWGNRLDFAGEASAVTDGHSQPDLLCLIFKMGH